MSWTPERLELLEELWKQPDITNKEIGRRVGFSDRAAARRAQRLGLGPRSRPVRSEVLPEDVERFKAAWRDGNLTLKDIASSYQASDHTAKQWAIKLGLPSRSGPPSSWTPKRLQDTVEMWQDGRSASQIARYLGNVTRSAVIAKLHRLGKSGRMSPGQNDGARQYRTPRSRVKAAPKSHPKKPFVFTMAASRKRTDPVMATELAPEPESAFTPRWVPLLDLPPTLEAACRFPNGNLFCGHPRAPGSRACQYHLPRMVSRVAKGL